MLKRVKNTLLSENEFLSTRKDLLVFVFSEEDLSSLFKLIKNSSYNKVFLINLSGFEFEKIESSFELQINILTPDTSEKNFEQAKRDYFTWLDLVAITELQSGKTVKDILLLDNELSAWWLSGLSQKKMNKTAGFGIFFQHSLIKSIVKDLNKFKTAQELDFCLIGADYYSYHALLTAIPDLFLGAKHVSHFEQVIKPPLSSNTILMVLRSVQATIGLMSSIFIDWVICLFDKSIHKQPVLAVTTNDTWEFSYSEKGSLENQYWPGLVDKLNSEGIRVAWLVTNFGKNHDVVFALRKMYRSDRAKMWPGCFCCMKIFIYWLMQLSVFRKAFITGAYQRKEFSFESMNLFPLLKDDLRKVMYRGFPEHLFLKKAFTTAFRKLKPIAILERKPFNEFGRLVISASKEFKVLGIQHGVVNDHQVGYLFTDHEVGNNQKNNAIKYCPVPDKMLVFGQRLYSRMVKYGYPKDWIQIIGDIKYDSVFEKVNTGHVRQTFQGPPFKILLCLQYTEKVVIRWAKLVAEGILKSSENVELIIKPHPRQLDMGIVAKEKAIQAGLAPDRVKISTSDIFSVLEEVDMVAVHSSTVGMDAIVYKRPLILIEQKNLENDNQVYKDSGLALIISSSDQLAEIVPRSC